MRVHASTCADTGILQRDFWGERTTFRVGFPVMGSGKQTHVIRLS